MNYWRVFLKPVIVFLAINCFYGHWALAYSSENDQLPRRASWGAKFKSEIDSVSSRLIGKRVTSITENSDMNKAGIKPDDVLLAVDGNSIDSQTRWDDITDALVAGKDYQFRIQRGNSVLIKTVRFTPLPKESYQGLVTDYEIINNEMVGRQRVIITRPENAKGKLPAVFIIQGLSCSSIEILPNRRSNFIRVLKELVISSNHVVMRVEKPGMGDSEGNCSQTDFYSELRGYEIALQTLLAKSYVDRTRVVVYGSSMGSAIAPYLTNKYSLKGMIADGTFFRSWFEHMLEIERRLQKMQGKSELEISQLINQVYIPLYYGMLIEKKSYRQVVNENSLLAKYNYHSDAHMYGRPVEY